MSMDNPLKAKSSFAQRPSQATQVQADRVTKGNAGITLTIERHETTPIIVSHNGAGPTIGERIDRLLADAARVGNRVAQVTLDLSDEAWSEIAKCNGEVAPTSTRDIL